MGIAIAIVALSKLDEPRRSVTMFTAEARFEARAPLAILGHFVAVDIVSILRR
jgi:hypothetical protein